MRIFVDADAVPRVIREVLIRVAERERINCVFVAACAPHLPESEFVGGISAGGAFDGADDRIVEELEAGDLVVTADIPLANRSLAAGAAALNPRGEEYTPAGVRNAMAMRELLAELRITGEVTGGAAPFSSRERERFTNALNRLLTRMNRKR